MCRYWLFVFGIIFFTSVVLADDLATNITLINNYNVRQNDDIWARIRAGFKLDHTETSRVKYFEHMYTKHPKSFSILLANAKPYLYYLLTEIERRGMPTELVFIPGIESSYNPLVTRPDDAYAGMWQFVPMTGRRFNMLQNGSIDERRDIIKSSKSALTYLNYLYAVFQQWDVAIGAYNWGEGGMYRAILDSDQTIGHVRYTDLKLRQITQDYEVKIIALANIIDHPSKFGVSLDDAPNQAYFAITNPETNTTISAIEEASQTDRADFMRLNPQYKNSSYTLSPNSKVLLPLPNQTIYYASIGKTVPSGLPGNNIELATNDAESSPDSTDNTPDPIMIAANNFGKDAGEPISYSPKDTAAANAALDDLVNNLDTSNQVAANTNNSHAIPTTIADTASPANSAPNTTSYVVAAGDTLYSIAKKFNMSVDDLRTENNLSGNSIGIGQVLTVK